MLTINDHCTWLILLCYTPTNVFMIFFCSTLDKMAYITIGKVLAQRCLECGISDMMNTLKALPGSKVSPILTLQNTLYIIAILPWINWISNNCHLNFISARGTNRKHCGRWYTIRRISSLQKPTSLGPWKTRKTLGTLLDTILSNL